MADEVRDLEAAKKAFKNEDAEASRVAHEVYTASDEKHKK